MSMDTQPPTGGGAASDAYPGQTAPTPAGTPTGTVDRIELQYSPAVQTAYEQYQRAVSQLHQAQSAYAAAQGDNDILKQSRLQTAVKDAEQRLQEAANTYVGAQKARADAYEKGHYTTDEEKQLALARAEDAKAQATLRQTQAKAEAETAPDKIAQVQAQTKEAEANAALTQAKLDVFQSTTDQQKQQATIAVQQAQANLQATQNANEKAGIDLVTARAQAAVAPQVAQATASQATSQAAISAANAAVAPDVAQATLQQAQINVQKAQVDLDDAKRRLAQAPTDEQAQQAIQLEIQQKQTALDTAQQQLDQAKQLMPGVLKQQEATLEATQAGTQATQASIEKGKQGPLYGLNDQIQSIRQMIANGAFGQDMDAAMQQGSAMLSDWVTKQMTGAGSFERAQAQDAYNLTSRQQDISQASSRLATGAGLAQGLFGQFANMAASAGPGHGADAAQAYYDTLRQTVPFFNAIGGAAVPAAPPSQVSQAPVVHINIGSGPPTSAGGQAPPAPPIMPAAQPAAAPVAAAAPGPAMPAAVSAGAPAAVNDVRDLWANEIASGTVQPFNFSGVTPYPDTSGETGGQ